jgi:hypothetical protein
MLAEKLMPAAHAGEDQASRSPEVSAAIQLWSTTNEDFDAETLSNLVIANDWLRAGDIVYVGEKKTISLSDLIDADDVILLMGQRSTALAGDAADGYPGVSDMHKRILNGALRGWMALCCPPEFFGIENVRKHTLTDNDLDAAARAVIGGAQ